MKKLKNYGSKKYQHYYKTPSGNYYPKYATLTYRKTGIFMYSNHMHKLALITPCAQYLLFYLVERMDLDTNQTIDHASIRQEFVDFMKHSVNKTYKMQTVQKAFNELKNSDFLINRNKANRYTVNPLYYFNGFETKRAELLGSLLLEACDPRFKNLDIVKKLGLTAY